MFSIKTFDFLSDLTENNNREWFAANKGRYEEQVREPALELIAQMTPRLEQFAPNFRTDLRKNGGSLMRVYRDTRFSRDKTPYKTNIGIQFRHHLGKDVHAPGLYLHIAVEECFVGVGCWKPESTVVKEIRRMIATEPDRWYHTINNKRQFAKHYHLAGDSLKRIPKGYSKEHVASEDLKRKDFLGLSTLTLDQVCGGDLVNIVDDRFTAAGEFMALLCEAASVEW